MKQYKINSIFLPKLSFLVLGIFLFFAKATFANSDPCLIRTDIEPNQTSSSFQAVKINQLDDGNIQWTNLDGGRNIDLNLATLTLLPNEKSSELSFKSFFSDIPLGAQIHGIQLQITGQSTNPSLVKESSIKFFLDESPLSINLGGKSNVSKPWTSGNSTWEYGYVNSDWGNTWDISTLQNEGLSVRIVIENKSSSETLEVGIDDLNIIVHYTPLYTLCDNDCVVVYNDDVTDAITYIWDLPTGVIFHNSFPNNNVVNLNFANAASGILNIGLTIITSNDTLICNRNVLHEICKPGKIGDFIWFDENFDGNQDISEQGFANIKARLFNPFGELISQTTSNLVGFYNFEGLEKGFYYIALEGNDILNSPKNSSSVDKDSDLNSDLKSDVFYLTQGDSIYNLDFGLLTVSTISGQLWTECDGNGQQESTENVAENVEIQLYKKGILEGSTFTDSLGKYTFDKVYPGEYLLKIISNSKISKFSTASNNSVKNDFKTNGTLLVNILPGEDIIDLDGAINPDVKITFQVYFDENKNDVKDAGEAIFDDQFIFVFQNNMLIDSLNIENGEASLISPASDNVSFGFNILSDFSLAENSNFNLIENGNQYVITGNSIDCESENIIVLKFRLLGATIGDFVWVDKNEDGIQDSNEDGIEGISLTLIDFNTQSIVDFTITDSKGFYSFSQLLDGIYVISVDLPSDYVPTLYDDSNDNGSKLLEVLGQYGMGQITIVNSENQLNWDAGLIENPGSIGDFVWLDKDRDGLQGPDELGFPNVGVRLYNDLDELVAETTTDDKGQYNFNVLSGAYYIQFIIDSDLKFTLFDETLNSEKNSDVNPENGNKTEVFTLNGAEIKTDIDAGIITNTAFIGNLVFLDINDNGIQDSDEIGLKNFLVEAFEQDGDLVASTISEEGGYYSLEVPPGNYYLKFSKLNFDKSAKYVSSSPLSNSDITNAFGPGTTDMITVVEFETRDDIDAGFLTINTLIGDYVWQDFNQNGVQDATEIGLADMLVNLIQDGFGIVGSTKTGNGLNNDRGYYEFQVDQPGNYYLQFVLPDNSYEFTVPDIADDKSDSDVSFDNGFGTTGLFFLEPGENKLDLDAGVIGTSSIIGDFVWRDDNNNGIQDPGENGINGMNVFLYDEFFNFLDVTITTFHQEFGMDGYYEFGQIEAGNYVLVFDSQEPFVTPNTGSNPDKDSDVTSAFVNGSTGVIQLSASTTMFNIDAGVINPNAPKAGTIGNMVWEDLNKNGIFETGEKGLPGVYLELLDNNNHVIADTETNEFGMYQFVNIPFGSYSIYCELPDDYKFTIQDNSFDDVSDSDVNEEGYTMSFNLAGGQIIDFIDIGMYPKNTLISGQTWLDLNNDNSVDNNEMKISDIVVTLVDDQGNIVAFDITNDSGFYTFDQLEVGDYFVHFDVRSPFLLNDLSSVDFGFTENIIYSNVIKLTESNQESLLNVPLKLDVTKASSIIDINAFRENKKNTVQWTSGISELAEFFIVESRTINGSWEYVDKVMANGEVHYFHSDQFGYSKANHIGYRVTQYNFDGSQIMSGESWIVEDDDISFKVHPNPASENPLVTFVIESDMHMNLRLISLDGKVNREIIPTQKYRVGEYSRRVDISDLPVGTYLLKYTSDKQSFIKKLIVE